MIRYAFIIQGDGVMKQWFVYGVIFLIAGCGTNSESLDASKELDGETGSEQKHPGLGIDLDQMKQSTFIHEFDVDLYNPDPLQRADTFTLSSADTYKISLKTLDFLETPKRFSLVKASNILETGIPKVIAPLGYKVTVKVQGNEVIAEIQSTTEPKEPPKLTPIMIGNDDIIVGDITPLKLQAAGLQKDVSFSEHTLGLSSNVHGTNRYLTYHAGPWITQVAQQQVGKYTLISAQTGLRQTIRDVGVVNCSVQGIYQLHDAAYVNVMTCKYTQPWIDGVGQWHVMVSYTLNSFKSVALGMGWTGKLSSDSKVSVGVVSSQLDVNLSVLVTLNP
jgi:hypothetical protein